MREALRIEAELAPPPRPGVEVSFAEPFNAAQALIPALVRCALVLLPEGVLICGSEETSALDHELLVRAASQCLAERAPPPLSPESIGNYIQYAFVIQDQYLVIQQGRTNSRLALASVCTREVNLAYVVSSTRQAMNLLEQSIDLSTWGV